MADIIKEPGAGTSATSASTPPPSTTAATADTADALRSGGERMLSDAKERVKSAAESQRHRAADAVRGMAGALHRAADDLKPENETMGRYTDMAAERLDRFAGYLRGTDWAQVVDEAENMARRQPAWFIGGAMAAGFLLARVIKNTAEPRRRGGDYASRMARRMPASSTAGYGTSTEAGVHPAGPATTHPISSSHMGTSAPPGSGPSGGEV